MITIGNHEYDHLEGKLYIFYKISFNYFFILKHFIFLGGEHDPSGAGNGYHPSWGNFGNDSGKKNIYKIKFIFDLGGECGVPMYNRFHMVDNGNSIFWYSFDYGRYN